MTHHKGIDWQPINNIPKDRKDGRRVLLWTAREHSTGAEVGSWQEPPFPEDPWRWEDIREGMPIEGVTHWADINPPA